MYHAVFLCSFKGVGGVEGGLYGSGIDVLIEGRGGVE